MAPAAPQRANPTQPRTTQSAHTKTPYKDFIDRLESIDEVLDGSRPPAANFYKQPTAFYIPSAQRNSHITRDTLDEEVVQLNQEFN